ncbi:class I SAM-dependent methyltransferase [Ectopseudomonas oleovorans]|uniref:class I SAM-dependent methyltransferase n=1 Tax=Ectopseudomonas oleovorans TaxID=301 RepID=UPI000CF027D8|nr:class I SAM-dependent methyltransferase [Pseudomonas oleovorans]PPV34370.1 methyltransferase type 11 [Pseudomonas oleovorans]
MSDGFYRAFEERYYASRSKIKELRKQYLPFVTPITALYPATATFDIGCGRGEWLELMLELGMQPLGVDLDEGMLEGCRDHGLPARQGDAVAYLSTLPSESQALVTAFHVVEHISFEQLHTVISEAMRVLKPGGLLIMETPNPENIVVATRNFYLDPTHLRPIPSLLLAFLPEHCGFARSRVVRLQESKDLASKAAPTLNDVFEGASPDYAVIAQKSADGETLALLDEAFAQEYGLRLDVLAGRYHAAMVSSISQAEETARRAEAIALRLEQHTLKVEAEAQQFHQQLIAIHQSTSWKITRPIRLLKRLASGDREPARKLLQLARTVAITQLRKYPRLENALRSSLYRFPRLHKAIVRLVHGGNPDADMYRTDYPASLQGLTPRARDLYLDLKSSIEKQKGEH